MSTDEHPLRYVFITGEIEKILFRRALEHRLDGHTLDTALEISELVHLWKAINHP
jgi:hypothetical protein